MRLTVKNVIKTYPTREKGKKEIRALDDVSFCVENGEFCAIVGESGSGKSTLSQVITGLIPATEGTVLLDDRAISPQSRRKSKALCAKIQLVLQDGKSALDPHFTIYRCIAEPLRNLCDLTREDERRRVLELTAQMELPEDILTRKPHELSGGQQKRVCIARGLSTKPDVLIFDEAISGLDVILRKSILDLLKRIHRENGCTIIFITHDVDVALYMANHIIVMKDGKIIEDVQGINGADSLTQPYSQTLIASMMPQINIPTVKV